MIKVTQTGREDLKLGPGTYNEIILIIDGQIEN